MNIQTSEQLQSKAMEMSKEHVEASRESGVSVLQGILESIKDDDSKMIEAKKIGAMIAATDFLKSCQESANTYTIVG